MPQRFPHGFRKRSSPPPAAQRRLLMEALEDRCLLSHSPSLGIGGFVGKGGLLTALGENAAGIHHPHHGGHASHGDAVLEREETATGQNDRQSDAQFLRHFGTGAGEERAISISGLLGPPPALVTPAEDDGAIPLANLTGLMAGVDGAI